MLTPEDLIWHETAQIIVVGCGLAGTVAAITARRNGASVIILEKQPASSLYSCSSLSGGVFVCPTNYAEAAQYMTALCQMYPNVAWTDAETIDAWARYSIQNKEWLENLGGNVKFLHAAAEYPQLSGADCIQVWRMGVPVWG